MTSAAQLRDAVLAYFLANPYEALTLADCCVTFRADEPDVAAAMQCLLFEGRLVWGLDPDREGPRRAAYRLPLAVIFDPPPTRKNETSFGRVPAIAALMAPAVTRPQHWSTKSA